MVQDRTGLNYCLSPDIAIKFRLWAKETVRVKRRTVNSVFLVQLRKVGHGFSPMNPAQENSFWIADTALERACPRQLGSPRETLDGVASGCPQAVHRKCRKAVAGCPSPVCWLSCFGDERRTSLGAVFRILAALRCVRHSDRRWELPRKLCLG